MAEFIRLIDSATGKTLFDSDEVIPEQLDPERDHIIAGDGWRLQTMEQCEAGISRPGKKDCPTCEGVGTIAITGDTTYRCPTCHGDSVEKKEGS